MVKYSCSVTTVKTCLRKGAWSLEEDQKLKAYIHRHGIWNWVVTPKTAGLLRTGKSCRLRWMNYLKPEKDQIEIDQKTPPEDDDILLSNPPKQSNFNADSSPSSSSGDQPASEIYNQIIEENSGSSETYVELQSLWDPVPAELFPMDYGTSTTHGFLFPNFHWGFQGNTSTLASYYDAGDDVSAYLLMQENEESV
ncbi:hypothetical protein EZV62_003220 [Acer yangbiense]|uniref:Uncharacterized protein n=1 Tax=Acer yangbiense TaxID=1000413 RepID=A0A5C7IGW2_9ROSI|nr:hypothetical protein EZV62_003220 [Acer yangbiense]